MYAVDRLKIRFRNVTLPVKMLLIVLTFLIFFYCIKVYVEIYKIYFNCYFVKGMLGIQIVCINKSALYIILEWSNSALNPV